MVWIKSLHIIFMVAWFAGLLYLPRLFVYHAECEDAAGRRRFALMEARLYWRIMSPAMVLTVLFGVSLLAYGFHGNWLVAKLALVALLIIFHVSCFFYMRRLRQSEHAASGKFFRFYNEIPALLLIAIVLLVTTKPF